MPITTPPLMEILYSPPTMTSAYGGKAGNGRLGEKMLKMLPLSAELKSGRQVEVDLVREEEWEECMQLLNAIIEQGRAWPFDKIYTRMEDFQGYFLSHTAFVVRSTSAGLDANKRFSNSGDVMGIFYIKPNYPGRCSHVCNGGFITKEKFRMQV